MDVKHFAADERRWTPMFFWMRSHDMPRIGLEQKKASAFISVHRRPLFMMLLLFMLAMSGGRGVHAQVLDAPWVGQAQKRIEQCRMTPVRVIVLDEQGRPAADAVVRVQLQRHAFPLGVRLNPADFADGNQPEPGRDGAPVWRCFNAASLELATAWPTLQEGLGQWDFTLVDDMLGWAERRGMLVRWGALTSADPGKLPPWVLRLRGEELRRALENHLATVEVRYGRRVAQFDVHGDQFDHDLAARRLGPAMIRELHEYAKAQAPAAKMAIRFEDALTGDRLNLMVRQLTHLRESFVPFDLIAVEQRLGGTVVQGPLQRALAWLEDLHAEVAVTGLEVGGNSPAGAALNLETVLRTLFAQPCVQGIWLTGVRAKDVIEPNAALVDEQGEPTLAGRALEGLIRLEWWTDLTARTDELGNVKARVMAGTYHITASAGGVALGETTVYLPMSGAERIVLLEPARPPVVQGALGD
jgi:GH35 family endo-1,4-beta-xylanase